MPEHLKRPDFDPQPPSQIRRIITSPSSLGTFTAAILAFYPRVLHQLGLHATQLTDAPLPLEVIPERVYAILVGFFLGYVVSKGLEWLRWQAIKSLLRYQGWTSQPKSMKTMAWALLLKLLKGPGPFSTYMFQPVLPKQPVPNLEDTLHRWLTVSECWLTPDEFEMTKQAVEDFRNNEGPKLQAYLIKRSQEKANWLYDYWMSAAYLSSRAPTPINSNYYCQTAVPKERTTDPLARSANMIHLACKKAQLIQEQRIPPTEFQDLVPICMHNYRFIYNSTRIPGEHIDTVALHSGEKHLIIARKGHFFKLNMFPMRDGKPELLTRQEIHQKLEEMKEIVDNTEEKPLPIASLTAQRRDVWLKHRNQLKEKNPDIIHAIDSALFMFVLDDFYPKEDAHGAHRTLCSNGYNVWFDKSFTYIVYEDAHMGCNIEHSVLDGTVMSTLAEYCMMEEEYEDGKLAPSKLPQRDLPELEKLEWDISGMEDLVMNAYKDHIAISSDVEVETLNSRFGKRDMKKLHVHPDGFVQMSIQLAYYRIHRNIVKTYQPATSRLFALGRTETIFPVSKDSVAFVKAMDDPDVPKQTKIDALKKGIKHHTKFLLDATVGQGCDRHLLGLYCASRELGMDIPKLFMDKAFSMPYTLSTSHLPTRMKEWGLDMDFSRGAVGFGPVCKEGYGVCYIRLGEDLINFHITSWKSYPDTDSKKLGQNLLDAMDDLKSLLS